MEWLLNDFQSIGGEPQFGPGFHDDNFLKTINIVAFESIFVSLCHYKWNTGLL